MALFILFNSQDDCFVKSIANGNFETTDQEAEAGEFTGSDIWENRAMFGNNWELLEVQSNLIAAPVTPPIGERPNQPGGGN